MKSRNSALLLLAVFMAGGLMSGCASYPLGSTKAEIWKARYEQNIIMESDGAGTVAWKCTKHALWDVFTVFIAEIHYGRIRRNHSRHVMLERQKKAAYQLNDQLAQEQKGKLETFKGKHYSVLLVEFGPTDRIEDDGMGGKLFVYENSSDQMKSKFAAWGVVFYGQVHGNREEHIQIFRVWFCVDKDGIIRAAGAREATQSTNR